MRWVLVFGLFIMTISGFACSSDEEPDTYNRGGPLPATSTPTPTPGPADTHKLKGVEFNYDEQWEDAIAEFDAALELDPGMADAHFGACRPVLLGGAGEKALTTVKLVKNA